MITEKDQTLIDFLLKRTERGKIRWEPTAHEEQFTTSIKGKYNVIIDKSLKDDNFYWLTLEDTDGREMLKVNSIECQAVETLFRSAKRISLNVDSAIDEIISS